MHLGQQHTRWLQECFSTYCPQNSLERDHQQTREKRNFMVYLWNMSQKFQVAEEMESLLSHILVFVTGASAEPVPRFALHLSIQFVFCDE